MSKLVGDKQSQTVSDGSFAVQVHGNVTYSGLSYNDVKDICVDMMRANFPILREDARKLSMEYVEQFGQKFFERIAKEDAAKAEEKLKTPDVQAAINSSVVHVARMTNKSHQDILCELLVEKIKENQDEKNIILNEAIEVTSKITINQIKYVAFVYLLRSVFPVKNMGGYTIRNEDVNVQYNYYENRIPNLIGNEAYNIDMHFMVYKGLCISTMGLTSYSTPLTSLLKNTTGKEVPDYEGETKITDGDALSINFPKLTNIIKKFGFDQISALDGSPITKLSEEVAKAYLRTQGIPLN
ncbi:hypothetical protein SH739_003505 [Escherichia coli]|nr:hypothetical protein [Escherichia coli]KGB03437.1 hypothetical protein DR73_3144 [Enterobacteriaceae bacterium ATCC 29904]